MKSLFKALLKVIVFLIAIFVVDFILNLLIDIVPWIGLVLLVLEIIGLILMYYSQDKFKEEKKCKLEEKQ